MPARPRISLLNLLLAAIAVFLYLTGYGAIAAALLVLIAYRVLHLRLARIATFVARLPALPVELHSNTLIICTINIKTCFEHACIDQLFTRLKRDGRIDAPDLDQWRSVLLENYRRVRGSSGDSDEVKFQVKSNVLFTDGSVTAQDWIFHSVTVPVRPADLDPKQTGSFRYPSIEWEIELRLLMVNGMLVLQLGEFDERSSPRVFRTGVLAKYQTYVTLAEFPMMYFHWRLGLPVRYLSLTAHDTESYKTSGRFDDWRQVQRDADAYGILLDALDSNEYNADDVDKLSASFEQKLKAKLDAGGFKTLRSDDNESWRYPDRGVDYWNSYLRVFFQNFNLQRDFAERHWWTDYREDEP